MRGRHVPHMTPQSSNQTGSGTGQEAVQVSFASFGVSLGLRANEASLLVDALLHLPVGWKPSPGLMVGCSYSLLYHRNPALAGGSTYRLYRDGRLLYSCADRPEFLERFASTIALYIADSSRSRVFIHAGVVGWGGSAILIPGRSFSGKTTLVAELVRAGATYYSDEFAVVDSCGMVYPYAQPLQIRKDGSFRQVKTPVEQLGGIAGREPQTVGLIVFTRHKTDAQWNPKWLSAGKGLLRALDNTISARSAPAMALGALKEVVSNAPIVCGVRGEAVQVVEWIVAHFRPHSIDTPSTK